MGLNDTVSAERAHIGFFGMRNAGKSSLVNAVTGQALSLVSDIKGTTTDPVRKAMELLPLGPVVIIDTPGWDDEGELGQMRVACTRRELNVCDLAVLVIDAARGMTEGDAALLSLIKEKEIPHLVVYNKAELCTLALPEGALAVSCVSQEGIPALKEAIAAKLKSPLPERKLLEGLVKAGDTVVLVVPIDESAPKGRLILPQQQTIRALLDEGCTALVVRDSELDAAMKRLKEPPALVITDSQVFGKVAKLLPPTQPLTSFSILFARYKGDLAHVARGAAALTRLTDDDTVLIAEGCSHHRQCGDIGTVKLPSRIKALCGHQPHFVFTSGREFPDELSPYRLVIHCGGCMLTAKEMQYRARAAKDAGIPFTNYGIALAHAAGILERSLKPFPDMKDLLARSDGTPENSTVSGCKQK